jgi:hypothetical protein
VLLAVPVDVSATAVLAGPFSVGMSMGVGPLGESHAASGLSLSGRVRAGRKPNPTPTQRSYGAVVYRGQDILHHEPSIGWHGLLHPLE